MWSSLGGPQWSHLLVPETILVAPTTQLSPRTLSLSPWVKPCLSLPSSLTESPVFHNCFCLEFNWYYPEMGEPGGLLSMGSHRVGHDWSLSSSSTWILFYWGLTKNTKRRIFRCFFFKWQKKISCYSVLCNIHIEDSSRKLYVFLDKVVYFLSSADETCLSFTF